MIIAVIINRYTINIIFIDLNIYILLLIPVAITTIVQYDITIIFGVPRTCMFY